MTIDPVLATGEPAVLDWIAAIDDVSAGLPDLESPDWAVQRRAARELADTLATRFTLPGPAECEVSTHRVPTRGGEVTVLRYHPPGGTEPRPAQLIMHGGGFVHGSVHEVINERLLRRRAIDSGLDFFDVDYRLAPEHPFPVALHDCVDALNWLAASAGDLGVDPDRIGVGGVSAGGNLAALVAVHARDHDGPRLHHQVLEVPAASLDIVNDDSFRDYGELESFGDLRELRLAYLGTSGPVSGWAAPADVPDLAGLPPALVLTAELDPLRDSGLCYAARLAAAGVEVETWCAPGQTHGSSGITATSATARDWQRRVSDFLRVRVTTTAS